MRTVRRPRRYVNSQLLTLLTLVFSYNDRRDAYVMRGVGQRVGPVLRADRRVRREPPLGGIDLRERARAA
jgi:hypothetical protein